MVKIVDKSSKSPLQSSLILMVLYFIFLVIPSFIFWLFFNSPSYFFFILVNFSIIFCFLALLWLIIVPYGIYLPKHQKSIQVYLNDIHLGKESFRPLKLIIPITIGWIGLIFGISLIVSFLTKGFQFNLESILKNPAPGKPSWFIFVFALIPAIWEEIAFRGVILNYYERKFQDDNRVIIYNGILFGLFHLINLLLGASLVYTLIQVIYSTLIGMYFAFMLKQTKKLYYCILTHYILDVLYFLFIYYV
jgi:membrane protease YdiL (CAAX protease family)